MRNSSSSFCTTLLVSVIAGLVTSSCSSAPPRSQDSTISHPNYYGQLPVQSSASDIIVNPSAPQSYVVQKGDTLWGIAQKFLNTPWYWPEVWDKNQGIANPHLIYPGDILIMDYAGGDKLQPRIRVERHGEGEPIASLVPFMLWPRVLDEASIKNAPYILSSLDNHDLITRGETIYVKGLRTTATGERLAVFHPNQALKDKNGRILGYEVTYGGMSRIDQLGDPAKATIIESKREMRPGDRLLAPIDEINNLNTSIHAPTFAVNADIIALFDAEYIGGNYMIATINKGARDGIEVGHTLGTYTAGKTVKDPIHEGKGQFGAKTPIYTQLPSEKTANLVIYKVADHVSYGLIMNASREVKNGDKIGNP